MLAYLSKMPYAILWAIVRGHIVLFLMIKNNGLPDWRRFLVIPYGYQDTRVRNKRLVSARLVIRCLLLLFSPCNNSYYALYGVVCMSSFQYPSSIDLQEFRVVGVATWSGDELQSWTNRWLNEFFLISSRQRPTNNLRLCMAFVHWVLCWRMLLGRVCLSHSWSCILVSCLHVVFQTGETGTSWQLAAVHKTDASGVGLTLLLDAEPYHCKFVHLIVWMPNNISIFQVGSDKCLV